MTLVLSIVLISLDVLSASRKALEPLWVWVVLSLLVPWIMLIGPARGNAREAV